MNFALIPVGMFWTVPAIPVVIWKEPVLVSIAMSKPQSINPASRREAEFGPYHRRGGVTRETDFGQHEYPVYPLHE